MEVFVLMYVDLETRYDSLENSRIVFVGKSEEECSQYIENEEELDNVVFDEMGLYLQDNQGFYKIQKIIIEP